MIRDTGVAVEFWLNSGSGSTWSDHIPWTGTVNGTSVGGTFSYPAGGGWKKVAGWNVYSNQTVTFRLGNTGTSGFGGPTTFNQFIQRATVPPAPGPVFFNTVGSTSVDAQFFSNGDGGSAIFIWQMAYGTDPTGTVATLVNSIHQTIGGLTKGTTYYFWGRGQNAQGYGPWSVRSQVTTLREPDAPSSPVISDVTQTTAVATFTPNGDGGSAILEYEVGWTPLLTGDPTDSSSGNSPQTLTDLDPGSLYRFSTRARNVVGWGPWSLSTDARLIAGARVKVGTTWQLAVPYVKHGGVWKLARPWGRVAGEWKQTS